MSGLALFGGTFDPIHNAHLKIAGAAADLCGLTRILFVPSGNPPHRAEGTAAPYRDRYAMVEIACRQDSRFEASRLEDGDAVSYSIRTIEKIHADHPGNLYFLIGADAFAEIHAWHRWRDVVQSVTFIVVSRPGAEYAVPESARVVRLEEVHLEISSSEIRRALAEGLGGLPLPAGVAAYIKDRQLYGHRSSAIL